MYALSLGQELKHIALVAVHIENNLAEVVSLNLDFSPLVNKMNK